MAQRFCRFASALLAILLVGALAAVDVAGASHEDGPRFATHLSGSREVPAVDNEAIGWSTFVLRGDQLDFRIIVSGADPVVGVHLHLGAADENGPVVVPIDLSSMRPYPGSDAVLIDGAIVGPDGGAPLDLIEAIELGLIYLNVHTEQFPAGALRGQVGSYDASAAAAVPSPTPAAEAAPVETPPAASPPALDTVASVVDNLNDFWAEVAPNLGFRYDAIPFSRISDGADGDTCNGSPLDPAEVAGNAFVDGGCSEGIFVAYDPAFLEVSATMIQVVLSHEWGHVIQFMAPEVDLANGVDALPVDGELQADCFSGAWMAAQSGLDLDLARQLTAAAGDSPDDDITDPDAHGTAEMRVAAFDAGVSGGVGACDLDLAPLLP